MLTLETMLLRLGVAVLVGAIVGFERELVGKEAGIRTDILVSAGSAIFTMVGLILPYLGAHPEGGTEHLLDIIATSRGFSVIAGVVTGIGFLGAGLILKSEERITGVTTAASIWFIAALGILSGIGFIKLALISAIFFSLLLYILRKIDLFGLLNKSKRKEEFNEDEF